MKEFWEAWQELHPSELSLARASVERLLDGKPYRAPSVFMDLRAAIILAKWALSDKPPSTIRFALKRFIADCQRMLGTGSSG